MEKITLDNYYDLMSCLSELGFNDYTLTVYKGTIRLILDTCAIRSETLSKLACKYSFKMYSTIYAERKVFEIRFVSPIEKA